MLSLDLHSPLQAAVDQMAARTVTASPMLSREWALLPAEVRLRSMFSSRVEHERTLAEMKARLAAGIANEKRDGATMDKGRFIEEMRAIIKDSGYRRPDGVGKKSLQNLKSRPRLELIWKMNVAQARGYAKWLADMTPEGLENEPCYELIRVMQRTEVRDWPTIWENFGGKFYGGAGANADYPREGRMIAAKTSPIWAAISRFGTPWPPFDWGSGMGLSGIDIDEAEALGVILPDATPQVPPAAPFNAGHSMSAKGIPESGKESLRSAFGDAVKFDNERIILQRHLTPETDEQRQQTITASLTERARRHYLQARDELDRLRRADDGTQVGFRSESESAIASIYIAQASAVAVGRKTLFHDTMTQVEAETFMRVTRDFPKSMAWHYENGHFMAWRRDLADLSPAQVIQSMDNHGGGLLLGYGMDSPAVLGEPHVLVRIFALPRKDGDLPLAGFHGRMDGWRSFAEARAADLAHAMDIRPAIEWEVRP